MLPVTYVVALSVAFQTAAAVMAFRLIAVTGRKTAWVLISLALALMAVRRVIPLYHLISGKATVPPDLLFESVGLVLSMAMALGIVMIAPLFRERIQAELAARESQERLLTILDSLDAIVYVSDMKTYEIIHINRYARELFGDIEGKICWRTIQTGQTGPCDFCTNDRIVDAEGNPAAPCKWEYRNTRTGRWFYVIDRAVRWVDGRIVRLEIATDITERKHTERKLQEQLHFLQQLLDSIPIPVYYKDTDGLYLGCNTPFETMMCLPRSDIVGKTVYELLPKERADIHHEADLALLRNPGVQEYELDGVYSDGEFHGVIFNKAAFVDEDNRVAGIIGVAIDITERKIIEEALRKFNEELELRVKERTALLKQRTEELEQAYERLKEADRAKSAFLASMSHELRTPLNSIIGFSSILHDEWVGPVNAEQKENLASILRSGRRLLNMISDVLDVTQIEAGAITPDIEEFELHDLIAEAENEVTAAIREKGLELRSEPLRRRMRTDRQRLLQCLRNILSNAVKFTDRGSVTVAARLVSGETPVGDLLEIAVTDTGIGIGEEDQSRIFQPFLRIITPHREVVPGTGLGLFLSRKIATEILKGDIIVCSEYGKGSRFSLRIPVRLP